MSKGLGRLALLLCLSLFALPAGATTTASLVITSDSGDAIGKGQSYTFSTPGDAFNDFAFTNARGVQMQVNSVDQGIWSVNLTAPPGQNLQQGTYHFPSFSADGASLQASFLLQAFSNQLGGCGVAGISGEFTILDIQRNSSNDLSSLAADFDAYCVGASAGVHGILRYNSTVPADAPRADAGPDQFVPQGASVALDASGSEIMGDGGSITTYQWAQLSGPAVTLSDTSSATPGFTAPDVALGGADLVFQLTVTDANSQTDIDTITVHVSHPGDPITTLVIESDPGDPAAQGVDASLTAQVATFAPRNDLDNSLDFSVTSSLTHFWSMSFVAPMQAPLQVAAYDQATKINVQFPLPTGMLVQNSTLPAVCNTLTGDFYILDIQRDVDGNVTSLAVDFDQYCNGSSAGLHGKLRYNSTVPLDAPFADAGLHQLVATGATVTLGGGDSLAGADNLTLVSYQWVQLSGPNVTLSDATVAQPTFASPPVPLGGADLTFQLTVTNSDGLSSASTVAVHVANQADPKTIAYAEEDPSNFIGPVQTETLNTTNALFSIGGSNNNVLGAAPNVVAVTMAATFPAYNMIFLSAANQTLQAGQTYGPLGQFTGVPTTLPQLGAELALPVPCGDTIPVGLFIVRDLQTSNGNVTSFAADFEDQCALGQPGLYGWVRYNSTVPLDTPFAVAGPPQIAYAGMPVLLDGSHSHIGLGGTMHYTWTQVRAAGDPAVAITPGTGGKASFTAPSVPTGGRTLNFQLAVDNGHGTTSTSTVAITVHSESDPKTLFYYKSGPTDPAGQGTSGMLTGADHLMGQPLAFGGSVGTSMQPIYPATGDWVLGFQESAFTPLTGPATGVFALQQGNFFPTFLAAMGVEQCGGGQSAIYVVRNISMQSETQVASLAVDFIQFCDGSSDPLMGAYRYNSTVPVIVPGPVAAPGPTSTVAAPATVTLDGSSSFPGWSGGIRSYSWQQVSGPKVAMSGSNQAVAQLTIPASMLTTSRTVLNFALTVTDNQGLSDTRDTQVIVALPSDSTLSLQSDAGDPVGLGATTTYSTANRIPVSVNNDGGILTAAVGNFGDTWNLQFATPKGQPLKAGNYPGAVKFSSKPLSQPGLYVNKVPAASACGTVSGDFKVLDVRFKGGSVASLAVDFDQTCNGAPGALHGKLRYHSAVP